ncbi:MAG: TIR domain-containing protein [Pikeienuella sp.]
MATNSEIDVFVSYKREERAYADLVQKALEQAGYRVVTDSQIGNTSQIGAAIGDMIRRAKCTMVLWTPAANASIWVQSEAKLAFDRNTYMGVMVERADLDPPYNGLNYVNVVESGLADGLPDILAKLKDQIGLGRVSAVEAEVKNADDQRELAYFQAMEATGSATAYRTYLEAYPAGQFVAVAAEQLKTLTNWRARLRRWLPSATVIGLVIAGLGLWLRWDGMQATDSEASGLQASVNQLQAEKSELESQLSTAQALAKQEKGRAARALSDKNTASAARLAAEAEIRRLNSARAVLETGLTDTQTEMGKESKRLQAERDALQGELDRARATAEAQWAEAARAEAALEKEISDLTAENQRLKDAAKQDTGGEPALGERPLAPRLPVPEPDCTTGGKKGYKIAGECYARDFTRLDLYGKKELVDISKLVGFTKLTRLDLSGTGVSDVTPLSGLVKLKKLYLRGARVKDLSPLRKLTALHHFRAPDGSAHGDLFQDTPETRKAVADYLASQ